MLQSSCNLHGNSGKDTVAQGSTVQWTLTLPFDRIGHGEGLTEELSLKDIRKDRLEFARVSRGCQLPVQY